MPNFEKTDFGTINQNKNINKCTNKDLENLDTETCYKEGKEQIVVNMIITNLLRLNEKYKLTSETNDSIYNTLINIEKNINILLGKSNLDNKVLFQLLSFTKDLKNDIVQEEKLFHIDRLKDYKSTDEEYILYNILQKYNPSYKGGYSLKELQSEFSAKNKDIYGFYFNNKEWVLVEKSFINNFPNVKKYIPSKLKKFFNDKYKSFNDIFNLLNSIDNNSKLENIISETIRDNKYQKLSTIDNYTNIQLNNSEKIINKSNSEIKIEDYLKYLNKPKNYIAQTNSIYKTIEYMKNNNIDQLQYDLNKGTIEKKGNINFSNTQSVIFIKHNNKDLDLLTKSMSKLGKVLVKENSNYIVIFPGTIYDKEILGLSVGNGIFYLNSNNSNINSTLAHESSHVSNRILNLKTLRDETIANYYGYLESVNNNDTFKANYIKQLLNRSDFLMHNSFGKTFEGVYTYNEILSISLIKGGVNYNSLKNLKHPQHASEELIKEYFSARDISLIALNPNTSKAQKGSNLLKIINDENTWEQNKKNALSVLAYLFPNKKYIDIDLEYIYNVNGGDTSWDGIMKLYKGKIKGNTYINGKTNSKSNFKKVYDLEINGDIIDDSSSINYGNHDVGGRVEINGKLKNGNHKFKGKVTGGLDIIINDKIKKQLNELGKDINKDNKLKKETGKINEKTIENNEDSLEYIINNYKVLINKKHKQNNYRDIIKKLEKYNNIINYFSNNMKEYKDQLCDLDIKNDSYLKEISKDINKHIINLKYTYYQYDLSHDLTEVMINNDKINKYISNKKLNKNNLTKEDKKYILNLYEKAFKLKSRYEYSNTYYHNGKLSKTGIAMNKHFYSILKQINKLGLNRWPGFNLIYNLECKTVPTIKFPYPIYINTK